MPDASLRARIRGDELLLGTFLNTGSPVAAELCGLAGFDWLLIDLEHGAGSEAGLQPLLHAVAATPAHAVVRVERGERLRIGRVLDLGAEGVMVPRVETPEEAAEAASYLRFPPAGIRGVALMTRGAGYGGVGHGAVAALNEGVVGIFQVESPRSVERSSEIASVDGVDVLFVGPSDLTHAMGRPGRTDEGAYDAAVRTVGRAARDAGKHAGVLLWRAEDLDRYADAGYSVFGLSSDGAMLAQGARALVEAFRSRVASRG